MATVRELLTKFSFKVDQKTLTNLDNGINNIKQSILVVGAAGVAAAAGLFGLAQSVANTGDKARKAAQGIGITTEAYQELGFVAQIGGLSQEAMGLSIGKLARTASDASRGLETYKRAYNDLGISVTDSNGELKASDELLMEVADSFAQMEDGTKKTALAMEIFGRSGLKLIPTLNQGSAAIKELRAEARASGAVMSDEAAQGAEEFNDTILRMKEQIRGIKNAIGIELIPAITDIVKGIIKWIKVNREMIKSKVQNFIKGTVSFLKILVGIVTQGIKAVTALTSVFGGLENILKVVAIALGVLFALKFLTGIGQITQGVFGLIKAMKTLKLGIISTQLSALVMPILIGAAIIALGLIFEDIIAFLQGKDSLTGALFEFIKKAGETSGVLGFLARVVNTISILIAALGAVIVGALTFDFDLIKEGLKGLIKPFKETFFIIANIIVDSFKAAFSSIGDIAKSALSGIKSFLGFGDETETGEAQTSPSNFGISETSPIGRNNLLSSPLENVTRAATMSPATAPAPSPGGASQVVRNISTNIEAPINISVPPGTQPEEIANKAKEAILEAFDGVTRRIERAVEPQEEF